MTMLKLWFFVSLDYHSMCILGIYMNLFIDVNLVFDVGCGFWELKTFENEFYYDFFPFDFGDYVFIDVISLSHNVGMYLLFMQKDVYGFCIQEWMLEDACKVFDWMPKRVECEDKLFILCIIWEKVKEYYRVVNACFAILDLTRVFWRKLGINGFWTCIP